MEAALAIIDKIIEEHKVIGQELQTLEQVANDAEAIAGLEKAKEAFMPGRLEQHEGLRKLKELLGKIERGLQAHFNREETALLAALEKRGDRKLVSTLNSLIHEHKYIRQRLAYSKSDVDALISGGLSQHVWEASAHDMRAHISHTRKLVEAHAEIEQELLYELRTALERDR